MGFENYFDNIKHKYDNNILFVKEDDLPFCHERKGNAIKVIVVCTKKCDICNTCGFYKREMVTY